MGVDRTRRKLITALASSLAAAPLWAEGLAPTPRQTAGPFYPNEPPLDDDNDLVRVAGQSGTARGRITHLSGRLRDREGRPLTDRVVEIWQCDANGRYHHTRDNNGEPDPRFQGFGRTRTDGDGRYRFRTIRPVPYPGRTPHIHFAVHRDGQRPFTTQLYVRDEPANAEDFLFNRIPEPQRERVLAAFEPSDRENAELEAQFDIVLGATPAD